MKRTLFIALLMVICAFAYAAPPPDITTTDNNAVCIVPTTERGSPTLATYDGELTMIIANFFSTSTINGDAVAKNASTARSIVGNDCQLNVGIPPGETLYLFGINLDLFAHYSAADQSINVGAKSQSYDELLNANASSAYPVGRNGDNYSLRV